MDLQEFERIKNTVKNLRSASQMAGDITVKDALPTIFGFKLTNRCNLRCKHCYEWNKDGYHHHMTEDFASDDLDFELIKKCVDETKEKMPIFYFWGGEPFIYYKIRELLTLLQPYDPVMAICTNGHLILEYMDLLSQFSSNLELVLALEGNEENNDALRGKGSYQKTIQALQKMAEQKKAGTFFAKLTVHTMISNENVDNLESFIDEMAAVGVENMILCFPWYISEECSREMDDYFRDFQWIKNKSTALLHGKHSWDAFKYHIEPENFQRVLEIIHRLRNRSFDLNLKFQPNLADEEILPFLKGTSRINTGMNRCLSLYSRMDVLPNGQVSTCKHFPEFVVGDLHLQSVRDIWCSEEMNRVRQIYHMHKSPACSKCNNFYLHGKKGKGVSSC